MNAVLSSSLLSLGTCWGWTLIHSIWQLALICLITACVARMMGESSASVRYRLMVIALFVTLALPVLTFLRLYCDLAPMMPQDSTLPSKMAGSALYSFLPFVPIHESNQGLSIHIEPVLLWAVVLWAIGFLATTLRLMGAAISIIRLRLNITNDAPDYLNEACRRIGMEFKLAVPVRVVQSGLAIVPTLLGFFRPLILFPTAMITGLTPRQAEMILAHELAHLARYDQLVNVLQILMENVFFFHPAVWWLSSRIRVEREECCDDRVLALYNERHEYASTLALLAEQCDGSLSAGMAATGGSLLDRIRHILYGQQCGRLSCRWMTLAFALIVSASILVFAGFGVTSYVFAGPEPANTVSAQQDDVQQLEQTGEQPTPNQKEALAPSGGQGQAPIGVVRARDVLKNSSRMKSQYAKLQEEVNVMQKEIDALSTKVKAAKDDYEKKDKLSKSQKAEKEAEFNKLSSDYQALLKENQKKVDAKEQATMKKITEELSTIVQELVNKENLVIIYDRGGDMVFVPKNQQPPAQIDLTQRVTELLDAHDGPIPVKPQPEVR